MKTSEIRKRRKSAGYAAICAIGSDGLPGALRVGAVEDIEILLQRIQFATWHPLSLVWTRWTPGIEVARTISDGVEQRLERAGAALGQHWYNTDAAAVEAAALDIAGPMRCPLWTDDEMIGRLRRSVDHEVDRFLANFG